MKLLMKGKSKNFSEKIFFLRIIVTLDSNQVISRSLMKDIDSGPQPVETQSTFSMVKIKPISNLRKNYLGIFIS